MVWSCGRKMMLVAAIFAAQVLGCESKPVTSNATTAESAAPASKLARTITVTTATYGLGCGVPPGNRTDIVGRECNGKGACSFAVSNKAGDPKPGCPKDFAVEYRCGADTSVKKAEHPAVTDENYAVDLKCD
jgi:hypothetical protein